MDKEELRRVIAENVPENYTLVAMHNDDVETVVLALAAAEALFLASGVKETPGGLTVEKIRGLVTMFTAVADAPPCEITRILPGGEGQVH